ncbi:MAG: hypothetical protein HUU38_00390 [Anaerolineales bacterium]|nr:hypothetical protein [Anaerolineales bacterium]
MNASSFFALFVILTITLALEGYLFWRWRKRKNRGVPRRVPPIFGPKRVSRLEIRRVETPLPAQVPARTVDLHPVGAPAPAWSFVARAGEGLTRVGRAYTGWFPRAEVILLGAALALYLLTRFVGLDQYPVYFNGDEAIHTVHAANLIEHEGYVDSTYLPTYFKNGQLYNLSLSVYVQIIPTLLFGKSVLVTRGTSILLTLIPALTVALIVRDFLKLPYGWAATLLLALAPVWFLHSRTAFETVLSVSMYAGFLYFYLRYRLDAPKHLYAALAFGALTFYAYSPAQVVIVACGAALLLLDLPYHLKHWQTSVGGLAWLLVLSLPYLRFRLQAADAVLTHLREVESYWLQPWPLSEKLARFFSLYFYGLSPGYWFFLNFKDIPRHQMGTYGNLMGITLPFALVGVAVALKAVLPGKVVQRLRAFLPEKVRSFWGEEAPAETHIRLTYRTILLALLIAPLPGTIAEIGNTRVLTFVLPITLLTAAGLLTLLRWAETHVRATRPSWRFAFAPGLFAVLGLGLWAFTTDALRNGPFWHQDYGFGGMQYGAEPLFDKIDTYLDAYNTIQITLTSDWANNSDVLNAFFLDEPLEIELASIDAFLNTVKDLAPMHLIVLTPEEYAQAQASGKFASVEVAYTLPYPNGQPGFYFVHLVYVDNITEILAEERDARHVLQEGTVTLADGTSLQVHYSLLDMGTLPELFDGNDQTVIRTLEANPFILEIIFPEPRPLQELTLRIGGDKTQITTSLTTASDQPPVVITQIVDGRDLPREKVINFGETYLVQTLRLEVLLVERGEPEHVHLWDLWLR